MGDSNIGLVEKNQRIIAMIIGWSTFVVVVFTLDGGFSALLFIEEIMLQR